MTTPTPLTDDMIREGARAAYGKTLETCPAYYTAWDKLTPENRDRIVATFRAGLEQMKLVDPPDVPTVGERIAERMVQRNGDNLHFIWPNGDGQIMDGAIRIMTRVDWTRECVAAHIDAALADRDGEIRAAREVARLAADSIQWGHETRDALEGVLRGIAQWDAPAILNAKGGGK